MNARAALRDATVDHHAAVDLLFSRFDLSQPYDYRRFLQAQAAALGPIEAAIDAGGISAILPDWPERKRMSLLLRDLEMLGDGPDRILPGLPLTGIAAMLGAVYVIEGSRMGAGVLRQQLSAGMPAAFLGARAQPRSWRGLLAVLDEHLGSPDELARACAAAKATFRLFEAAGLRQLELVQA
jgi:heme oxygenase (biliverdin-IX-beta and delta-forming)